MSWNNILSVKNNAQQWFNQIMEIVEKEEIKDIKTDVFMDVESIVNAIINYTFNNSIDLIVMGTKGRTRISKFLLGNVANGVMQHLIIRLCLQDKKSIVSF